MIPLWRGGFSKKIIISLSLLGHCSLGFYSSTSVYDDEFQVPYRDHFRSLKVLAAGLGSTYLYQQWMFLKKLFHQETQ